MAHDASYPRRRMMPLPPDSFLPFRILCIGRGYNDGLPLPTTTFNAFGLLGFVRGCALSWVVRTRHHDPA